MSRWPRLAAGIIAVISTDHLAAQNVRADTVIENTLRNHLERSYVTFTGGLGNGPAVLFEGNIAPPFVVVNGARAGVVLTPKVILRMMRTESWPVHNPSYMPRLTGFYKVQGGNESEYMFLTISHHSNGQDGPFYNPDGSINEEDGSFSTNFVDFGFQHIEGYPRGVGSVRMSIEYHPESAMDEHLRELYSRLRVHGGAGYSFGDEITGALELTYLADPTPYTSALKDRFQVAVNTTIKFKGMQEIAFLVNAYYGQDYYNMQFTHRVTMLRFGIATTPPRSDRGPVARTH
jgi:hypothetical protein